MHTLSGFGLGFLGGFFFKVCEAVMWMINVHCLWLKVLLASPVSYFAVSEQNFSLKIQQKKKEKKKTMATFPESVFWCL